MARACDDVVPAVHVAQEIVQQIAPVRPVPEMVVRIYDRQIGLEDRLLPSIEPVLADRKVIAGNQGNWRGG